MSVAPHLTSGVPDGTEGIAGVISDTRKTLDTGNRVVTQDSYHTPPATWIAGTGYGSTPTNFYRKTTGYDSKGRVIHSVDWTGTIRDFTFDGRDRMTATKIGTNDTTSPNMIQDMGFQYDGGGIGNGNLTKSSTFTSATASLDTLNQYDFRDRRTQVQVPDGVITVSTLDNFGRETKNQVYAGSVGSANLRAQFQTVFDEKGQIYHTTSFNVDPSNGTVRDSLTTNRWSNARGLQIKSMGPNKEPPPRMSSSPRIIGERPRSRRREICQSHGRRTIRGGNSLPNGMTPPTVRLLSGTTGPITIRPSPGPPRRQLRGRRESL